MDPAVGRERARVERALAWAQKVLRTAYHLELRAMPLSERTPGIVFVTEESARGGDDPGYYRVTFNTDETATLKTKDLRRLAGHEVLHALLWPLGAPRRREEAVVYHLQRVIFGEVGEE